MAGMLTLISPRLLFFLLSEQNENNGPLPPFSSPEENHNRHVATMTTTTATTRRACNLGSRGFALWCSGCIGKAGVWKDSWLTARPF